MTNFELIKNMSIDEMAACDFDFFACPYGTPYNNCENGKLFDDDCEKCIKHWLESNIVLKDGD